METSCQLYAISPPNIEVATFLPELEAALKTGAVASFQLRLKDVAEHEIEAAIQQIKPRCAEYGVAFILNDSLELAIKHELDGVHLGQEDLNHRQVKEVRAQLPEEMVLGITCHASSHLAMEAAEQGADYVAFGAFYPTTSKPKEKLEKWGVPDLDLLAGWSVFTTIPSVAIGGITPQNLAPLVQNGADFVAAITGIWNHPQGAEAGVRAYSEAIQEALAANDQG